MSDAGARSLVFAIPGDLHARTGGYGYDRRMRDALGGLGWRVRVLALGAGYPTPSADEARAADAAFAALPDGSRVLVDGLAFGAMDALARREGQRLRLSALVHHPLALETGLAPGRAAALRAGERAALERARSVIATSRTTREVLLRDYGVPAAKLTVAPPGTEPVGATARVREDADPVRIVAVGTLIPRKGHDVLLAALARLAALPWRCRIVGGARDAATAAALERQARALGIADRVRFVGEVEAIAPELARADVFALASRHEGYGMVFAEALAHGLPVVGCRAGAVPEVVPEDAGRLVAVDDAEAFAEALRPLLVDASARLLLAAGARAAARRLPTWEASARLLSEALEAT